MILTLEVTGPQAAALGPASRHDFSTAGGVIGRAKSSDWVLSHQKVSGCHAVISFLDGVFYVEDRSKNGVCINSQTNKLVTGRRYALHAGDRILIDPYEIDVTVSTREHPAPGRFDVEDPFAPARGTGRRPAERPPRLLPRDLPEGKGPAPEPVPGEELDPLKLIGGAPKQPPVRQAPDANDLDRRSLLSEHYQPPDVVEARPKAKPADPFAIPADYDPLSDDFAGAEPLQAQRAGSDPGVADRDLHVPPEAQVRSGLAGSIQPAKPDRGTPPPIEHVAPPGKERDPAPIEHAPPVVDRVRSPIELDVPALDDAADARPKAGPDVPASGSERPVESLTRPPVALPLQGTPSIAAPGQASRGPAREAVQASIPAAPAPPALGEVLAGAGLDNVAATPELLRSFGEIFRVVVSGVMDVLQSRQQVKDEFRMRMTRFRPVDNNPLKFSANVDDALHNLLVKRNPAYLGPVEAFEDAFEDLRNHQLAMLAGMRVAFESLLAEFDAARLEKEFDRQLKRIPGLGAVAKLKYWDLYREFREEMAKDPDASFKRLFGEQFAKAYEEQLDRLKAESRGKAAQDEAGNRPAVPRRE